MDHKPSLHWGFHVIAFGIAAVLLAIHAWGITWLWQRAPKPIDWEFVGDVIAVSTSLFTALAFIGLLYAVGLQRRDLENNWLETRQNSEELADQRRETRAHNTGLVFFQILQSFEQIVEASLFQGMRGRIALAKISEELVTYLNNRKQSQQSPFSPNFYEEFYPKYRDTLGHMFRLLYHIVAFVDASDDVSEEQKRQYMRILRAHLSNPELLLLFYNGLSCFGRHKFYALIEKYLLLQNLDQNSLSSTAEMTMYPQNCNRKALDD